MESVTLPQTQPTTQLVSLTWNLNRVEDRLYQLKLRQDLFLPYCRDERIFASLPARVKRIRQKLEAGRINSQMSKPELEQLAETLKDLETDLDLRELLQVQRSLINYLSSQHEESYQLLNQRWKQLAALMVSIDALVINNPGLASRKRQELETGLKELEEFLRKPANTQPPGAGRVKKKQLAQAS